MLRRKRQSDLYDDGPAAGRGGRVLPGVLLVWYVLVFIWMASSPVDSQNWAITSVLPVVLVGCLVATWQRFPLSTSSYAMIALFLMLHTVGAHYTYAQVPLGHWLEQALDLSRNPFDRFVHFCFGLLLTYPLLEVFLRAANLGGIPAHYLSFMTPLGLSNLWEILESWVARVVSPQLGDAYLGSQGDIWDAQRDMAAALVGSLLCLVILGAARRLRGRRNTP